MKYDIRNLSFGYASVPVIEDVDLTIEAGDFMSIIGPNGAGKSTLLKLMTGLISGSSGTLLFEGRPISDYRPSQLAQKLAFVPQETHIAFPFTASEMVMMGAKGHRAGSLFDSRADMERARDAMVLTETAHLASRSFTELSGGERQRIVLASALVQEPEVLLLDEPTVYLDMKHQLDFYRILRRLNSDGLTVVAVTHDVNVAGSFSKRIVVLSAGRLVIDGTPREVLTPALFETVFEIKARVEVRPEGGTYVIPSI